MWIQVSGMKKLEKSIKPGNYKTLWIAGKSSELVDEVKPVKEIIDNLKSELDTALMEMEQLRQPANLKL